MITAQNHRIIEALAKEIESMLQVVNRFLKRFGVMVMIDKGPLTEEEWEYQKVLPLYQVWLKNPDADDEDILDPESVAAFRRGEITFDEIEPLVKA